jgi:hypothetical protein
VRHLEIAAEVRPDVDLDKLASQIRKLNVASQDDERLIETATKRNGERRKKIGLLLIEARKGFNQRGDGFQKYVETQGLSYQTAIRYMREAGYVSPKAKSQSQSDHYQNDNEPFSDGVELSESDSSEPDPDAAPGDSHRSTSKNDFDPERESVTLKNKVVAAAEKWPAQYRSKLIQELRLAIKMIEVMK